MSPKRLANVLQIEIKKMVKFIHDSIKNELVQWYRLPSIFVDYE